MGYAYYILPDGREAGYGVEATCDRPGCDVMIDRGLGYLCGRAPDGYHSDDEWGCRLYFCGQHLNDHDCPNPQCWYGVEERLDQCENGTGAQDAELCELHSAGAA